MTIGARHSKGHLLLPGNVCTQELVVGLFVEVLGHFVAYLWGLCGALSISILPTSSWGLQYIVGPTLGHLEFQGAVFT